MAEILLFQPAPLGDAFFTSALSDIIKRELPDSEVYFFSSPSALEMVQDNPNIDGVIRHTGSIFKDIINLRKKRFDFLIDTWAIGDAYYRVFFAKAKRKVALRKKESEKYLVPIIYTEQISYNNTGYVFWDRIRLLSVLGIDVDKYVGKELPVYHISDSIKNRVKNTLKDRDIDRYILMTPKGLWKTKDIPVYLASEVIKHLYKDGWIVVLSAHPSEKWYLEEIRNMSGLDVPVITTNSLREFGALILFSEHLISVESLPYHLAIGLRKSATVVLGGYPIWKPDNYDAVNCVNIQLECKFCAKKICPKGDYECLEKITPQMVIDKVYSQIG
ncbi:glycosyltransferase family 9 protein [Persephonella sp.]